MDRNAAVLAVIKPGDKLQWLIGFPRDIDDMEVISVADGKIKIKFQVYGSGPWHEAETIPSHVVWKKGSEFAARMRAYELLTACDSDRLQGSDIEFNITEPPGGWYGSRKGKS